jgi:hypothetical protein
MRREATGFDGDSDAPWEEQDPEDRERSKKEGQHGIRPCSCVAGEEDKRCPLDVHCHVVVALVLRREGQEHECMDALPPAVGMRHLDEWVRCCRLLHLSPSGGQEAIVTSRS